MSPTFILISVFALIALAVWYFSKTGVISEDTKYLIFNKEDEDKMDPEEFKKAMAANKKHEEMRKEVMSRKSKKND